MANDYNTVMQDLPQIQSAFEACIERESTTAWMDGNATAETIRWISDREVRMLSMEIDGLGDAPAECGDFPTGNSKLATNIYQLGITRTRHHCFGEDAIDDFGGEYPIVMEFLRLLRVKIVDEIDAFRWSKIYNYALGAGLITNGNAYTTRNDGEKLVDDIQTAVLSALDNRFRENDLKIAINSHVKANVLDKYQGGNCCSVDASGNIVMSIASINGIPIISVPDAEFNSKIILNGGFSGDFGFDTAPDSMKINFMIMSAKAPVGLVKHNNIRVFPIDQNRKSDSLDITAKLRHDLLITKCNVGSLYANTQ